MSLLSRWLSGLGASRSKSSQQESRIDEHCTDSRISSTASHHSLPSIPSLSLKAPSLKPVIPGGIARRGPPSTFRRTLESDDGQSVAASETNSLRSDLFGHQSIALTDYEPSPQFQRIRNNTKFFQSAPLSVEQIRNMLWVETLDEEEHHQQTAKSVDLLRQRKRHCDVRIITDSGRLYCHKAILVTFSKELRNRLEASSLWKVGKISVDLTGRNIDHKILEMVVEWMYTGMMHISSPEQIVQISKVAEELSIPDLCEVCEQCLPAEAVVQASSSTHGAVHKPLCLREASSLSSAPVIPSTVNSSTSFHKEANQISTSDVITLSPGDFAEYIAIDTFPNELERYTVVVRWVTHDEVERYTYLPMLSKRIKWAKMTAEQLIAARRLNPDIFAHPSVSRDAANGAWERELTKSGLRVNVHER